MGQIEIELCRASLTQTVDKEIKRAENINCVSLHHPTSFLCSPLLGRNGDKSCSMLVNMMLLGEHPAPGMVQLSKEYSRLGQTQAFPEGQEGR